MSLVQGQSSLFPVTHWLFNRKELRSSGSSSDVTARIKQNYSEKTVRVYCKKKWVCVEDIKQDSSRVFSQNTSFYTCEH